MAWQRVTFRSELDPTTRKELDRDNSRLRGWQSNEHKSDGSHGRITAEAVTIIGDPPELHFIEQTPAGRSSVGTITTEDGSILWDSEDSTYFIMRTAIGDVLVGKRPGSISGSAAFYAGIVFDSATLGGTISYGLGAGPSSLSAGRDAFALYDVTNNQPILKFWKNAFALGTDTYLIAPDLDHSVADVYLGYRSDPQQRFIEVAGTMLYGENGVQERQRTVSMGEWTTPTGTFSGSGSMTWTSVTQTVLAYTLVGKTMTVSFNLSGTIGGTPSTACRILIPGSNTAAKAMRNYCWVSDATSGIRHSYCQVSASGTYVEIYLDLEITGNVNWGAGANQVVGQITFEIA